MDKKILVAYASKYGATEGIAQKIGEVLTSAGWQVDVLPAERAKNLESYTAVVLGSGVYIGKWLKDAAKFLEANENALAQRPVWLFSSGPLEAGDPVALLKGWLIPTGLQPVVDRIQPRQITVFHGCVDMEKLNFIDKFMLTNIKSPVGDYRDWDAISAWAEGIAAALN